MQEFLKNKKKKLIIIIIHCNHSLIRKKTATRNEINPLWDTNSRERLIWFPYREMSGLLPVAPKISRKK